MELAHITSSSRTALYETLRAQVAQGPLENLQVSEASFEVRFVPGWTERLHTRVLTCVAPQGISVDFLQQLFALLGESVKGLRALSQTNVVALDVSVSPPFNEALKLKLEELSERHHTDIAHLNLPADRTPKRLVVFDMDSTLIGAEVIDELAVLAGVGDRVKAITARAMNGELNFEQSLTERVALLQGLDRRALKDVHDRLPLNPGVEAFIKTAKSLGIKTAIVSGGFTVFAEALRHELGMDFVFANELEFTGDKLKGTVTGKIINAEEKARILEELARREGLALSQVVAIGDGANDLPMLARAGVGVAYHAKPKVRAAARLCLSHGPMTSILYYLGIPGDHVDGTL